MFVLRIFNRARRRFGFWRTVLAAIVLLWAFAFAAKAFAAPRPGHTFKHDVPPLTRLRTPHFWGDDATAFGSLYPMAGCVLASSCWEQFSFQARMLRGPVRGRGALNAQLRLVVSWDDQGAGPCADPVCLTTPPPLPAGHVFVFIDGHAAFRSPTEWHWTSSSFSSTPDENPRMTYDATFVSSPLSLGLACGYNGVSFAYQFSPWLFMTKHLAKTIPFYVWGGRCPRVHHKHKETR